ncbi:hypothetical protein AB1K62_05140 [Parasphingorhabdus sp. JC815]|uniref:hypothetical protein n=1 Tax=Parasphingorhabdus sp. JC815 TaxID=3232140 RepID=UPI00345B16CC
MTHTVKISALALILSAGLATPAMADVQVVGTVDVNKDIVIDVDTFKDKNVDVDVVFDAELDGSAQSDAVVNATIDSVEIGPIEEGVTDEDIDKEARTNESVNENTGIVQFNQDAGQTTNQGNVVSAAVVFSGEEDSQVVMSEAYADQRITDSSATHQEGFDNLEGLVDNQGNVTLDGDFEFDLTARITNSYNGNTGIVQGNQNVGNANNQHNVLSAAVGDNALVALSDAGLGQENSGNTLLDVNTLKTAIVANSMNGNSGVTNVNQATGAFNNQATVISVAALSSAVGLGQ